jgi:hypothetical protein
MTDVPCNSVCGAMCENGCLFGGCGEVCAFPNNPPPPATGGGSGGSGSGGGAGGGAGGGGGGVWTLGARTGGQPTVGPQTTPELILVDFIRHAPEAQQVRVELAKALRRTNVKGKPR